MCKCTDCETNKSKPVHKGEATTGSMVLHGISLSDDMDTTSTSDNTNVDGMAVMAKFPAGHPHCDNNRTGACPGHCYTSGMSDNIHPDVGEGNDSLG